MKWVTILDYALAFVLCGAAALSNQKNARFWAALCLLMLLLGAFKAVTVGASAADYLQDMARRGGWYEVRRTYQGGAIVAVLAVASIGTTAALYRKRHERSSVQIAAVAVIGLLAFVAVRTASLHQIDALLGRKLIGVSLGAAIENAAIASIAICAALASRRSIRAA